MKKSSPTSFGEQIRSLREASKLSLKEVAIALKIDPSLLAKFERNERQPSKDFIQQIAAYYEVDSRFLIKQCLSDQIAYKMLDEEEGIEILKVAEQKIAYLKSQKQ